MNDLGEYLMVAAIDFGTTFSGYAFSFKTDKENIMMNKNWGSNLGFQSYKTPTCVLINPQDEFDSFGFDAEHKYGEIVEGDPGSEDWSIFKHFKMTLHKTDKSGKISRSNVLCSSNGSIKPAMDIFVMSLRFLKKHMVEAVAKQVTRPPTDNMIRWVITVPAIWSEESKQFMREAAFKAGFMDSLNSRQLVVALEPEAASLYCRRLDVTQFMGNRRSVQFQRGMKYLVIDSGGGTVDVTAHEILPGGNVKELHAATGGAWGGTKVDNNFIQLLNQVLDEKFVKAYRTKYPQQWLNMMVNFEKIKRSVKPNGSATMNLQLSWAMGSAYSEIMGGNSIEEQIKSKSHLGVSFNNGMLIIKHKAVKDMFDPVLRNITDHIASLLKFPKLNPCKYFFLVGGFSESEFLQQAIIERFGGKIEILVPNEAQMSVIKGAVLFGHNPDEIKCRVARKTYGYMHLVSFEEGKHDPKKKELHDGLEKCTDVFGTYIEEGQEVENGCKIHRTYTPVRSDLTSVDLCFYCMDGKPKPVQYIDEFKVQSLGSLHIDMPITKGGRERKVETDIIFGGTEILVEATDVASGKTAKTKLDFLTS